MAMLIRRAYNKLTEKEKESIMTDLLKSSLTYKELAEKHQVFPDVITRIAKEMGLLEKDPYKPDPYKPKPDIYTPKRNNYSATVTNKAAVEKKKEPEKKQHKKHVYLTDEQKSQLRNEAPKMTMDQLMKKWKVSSTTIKRILNEDPKAAIKVEPAKKEEVAKVIDKIVTPVPVKEEKKPQLEIKQIDPKELIELSEEETGMPLVTRADDSYKWGDISYFLFPKGYEGRPLFDYRAHLEEFAKKYLKKHDKLQVMIPQGTTLSMAATAALCLWCNEKKINLTIFDGKTDLNLVEGYSKLTKNFQTLIAKTTKAKRYLYKTELTAVLKCATVYFTSNDTGEVVITDSFDKAMEYVARYEKNCHEALLKHTLILQQCNCGNHRVLFTVTK